ncbi:hypothetical protein R1flu_000191 [Riccia fluitans]|uniref:J domain-containing protein n=1 Tax=Riccia fluitans TaxID=41844 RepID=A0ABD1XZQ7_9MARC
MFHQSTLLNFVKEIVAMSHIESYKLENKDRRHCRMGSESEFIKKHELERSEYDKAPSRQASAFNHEAEVCSSSKEVPSPLGGDRVDQVIDKTDPRSSLPPEDHRLHVFCKSDTRRQDQKPHEGRRSRGGSAKSAVSMISKLCKRLVSRKVRRILSGSDAKPVAPKSGAKLAIASSDPQEPRKSPIKGAGLKKVEAASHPGGRFSQGSRSNRDQTRAAKEREKIPRQAGEATTISQVQKPKVTKVTKAVQEEYGCPTARYLLELCDILQQQQTFQTAVPGPRSRSSVPSSEKKREPTTTAKASFSMPSPSNHSVPAETKRNDFTTDHDYYRENQAGRKGVRGTTYKKEPCSRENCKKHAVPVSHSRRNQSMAKDCITTTIANFSTEPPAATSKVHKSRCGKNLRAERPGNQKAQGVDLDVFHEIEGESPRRRRLRYDNFKHLQAWKRASKKIAEMRQQEEARQQERDEKMKIACVLDPQIAKWYSGKEADLRALLSTLQNVLWSECTIWKVVSSSELASPSSVKKVYRRASFCLHPDKVQQRGGTIEQKYISEKVFGVLREAWNKFQAEELS